MQLKKQLFYSYQANVPVMIWGAPGIGKTSIVNEFAKDLKLPVVNLVLSQLEAIDLIGLPYISNDITKYAKPFWWPDSPAIIFLDELNRAQRYEINAIHQLSCESRLHNYELPKGSFVVGACNPPSTEHGLTEFGDAFFSRFAHIEFKPDREKWISFARDKKINENVINLAEVTNDIFSNSNFDFSEISSRIKLNPRSLEYVSKLLTKNYKNDKFDKALWSLIDGLIGKQYSTYLLNYTVSNDDDFEKIIPIDKLFNKKTSNKAFGDDRIADDVYAQLKRWINEKKFPLINNTIKNASNYILIEFKNKIYDKKTFQEDFGAFFEFLKLCPKPIQLLWSNSLIEPTWIEIINFIDDRYLSFITGELE